MSLMKTFSHGKTVVAVAKNEKRIFFHHGKTVANSGTK